MVEITSPSGLITELSRLCVKIYMSQTKLVSGSGIRNFFFSNDSRKENS